MSLNLQRKGMPIWNSHTLWDIVSFIFSMNLFSCTFTDQAWLGESCDHNFVAGFDTTACNDQVSGSGLRQRQSQIHPFYHVLRAGIRGHAETDRWIYLKTCGVPTQITYQRYISSPGIPPQANITANLANNFGVGNDTSSIGILFETYLSEL